MTKQITKRRSNNTRYKVWAKVQIEKVSYSYDKDTYKNLDRLELPVCLGSYKTLKEARQHLKRLDEQT